MRAPRARVAMFGLKFLPSRGGVSRVVEDLLLRLRDRYDLTVYCESHPDASAAVPGVRVVQIPRWPLGSFGVALFYLCCCVHLLWRGGQDLVHVHKTDAAAFLPLLTRRFRCIATSHEAPYKRDKWSALGRLYFRGSEWLFMRSPALLTCISRPLCREYETRWGRPVHFLPNGVDCGSAVDRAAAARVLAGLGIEKPFLLFAARRLMATKGAHTLLEALRQLEDPPPVVLLGDLDQLPGYTRRLRALAAGLEVHFAGFIADKATLLGLVDAAELFVFPSETEGMSIMLLEVARIGTPVVASDIAENRSVFDASELLYFESGDAADLARKIAQARGDPEASRKRGARARARVREHYEAGRVADGYAALYEQVLERGANPGTR